MAIRKALFLLACCLILATVTWQRHRALPSPPDPVLAKEGSATGLETLPSIAEYPEKNRVLVSTAGAQKWPEAPTEASIRIRAQLEPGVWVPGIEIWDSGQRPSRLLGVTDRNGALEVVPQDSVMLALSALSESYVSEDFSFLAPFPSEIILPLESTGTISGQVVFTSGTPVGPEFTVVACDSRQIFNRKVLQRPLQAQRKALTDANGRYVITGLRSDATYSLIAGAKGYMVGSPLANAMPNTEAAPLVVQRCYGVIAKLEDDSGEALAMPGHMRATHLKCMYRGNIGQAVTGLPPAAELAGISPDLKFSLAYWPFLFLSPSESEPEKLGPIECKISLPGYEVREEELWAMPIAPRVIEQAIKLKSLPIERGSLEVFLGTPVQCEYPRLGLLSDIGFLTLRNESGKIQFVLDDLGVVSQVYEEVPAGEYTVNIQLHSGIVTYPLPGDIYKVRIGSAPAYLDFDLSDCGAINCAVMRENGSRLFHENINIELAPARHVEFNGKSVSNISHMEDIFLDSAPYCVAGLPAGDYYVRVTRPIESEFAPVHVEGGAASDVQLVGH